MRYFLVFIICSSVCACTNRQIYEGAKANQVDQCNLMQTVQREECLKHLPPSYNEYERERQNVNKK